MIIDREKVNTCISTCRILTGNGSMHIIYYLPPVTQKIKITY